MRLTERLAAARRVDRPFDADVRTMVVIALAVALVAFGVRLAEVLVGGGLLGRGNYDDSVYFSAAEALQHGRLPYRDFLFLQPPGILVVLAPFAALARLVGDAAAFGLARLCFILLGALNAATVVVVLRRFGATAMLAGGLCYALLVPAAYAERSTLLEPIGSAAVLIALAALPVLKADAAARLLTAAVGVLVGIAIDTKAWYVLPAVILALALRRRAVPFLVGAIGTAAGLVLPFALADPRTMWREVLVDQLGRPRTGGTAVARLGSIVQPPHLASVPHALLVLVAAAALVALGVAASAAPAARIFVALLASSVLLLLAAPSYYRHYAALAEPAVALVVGVGVASGARALGRRTATGAAVPLVAASALVVLYCLAGWVGSGVRSFMSPAPDPALLATIRRLPGCGATDTPALLILSGTLSKQLQARCPLEPDFSGWIYDLGGRSPGPHPGHPATNRAWQAHAVAYLGSADWSVTDRNSRWLNSATRLRLHPTTSVGGFVVGTGH